MPRVARSRVIAARREAVWKLISDPHNLPRWWPRAARVEDVRGTGARMRWTTVLETERGVPVRADYRCAASEEPSRFEWRQEVDGTPFERILKSSALEIRLERAPQGATDVRMTAEETLRGFARLGALMLRGAAARRLDEALAGIELALVGEPG